jgi:hypothetical protein
MLRLRRWVFMAFLLVAPGSILAAQDSTAAESAWRRLPSNARLRIATPRGIMIARFVEWTNDTIYLRGCERRCQPSLNGRIRLPVNALTRVEVQRGHRTLEGLIVGVLVGGALGGWIGLAVGDQGDIRRVDMMLALGLTGGIGGAIFGPLIGSTKERWKPLPSLLLAPQRIQRIHPPRPPSR